MIQRWQYLNDNNHYSYKKDYDNDVYMWILDKVHFITCLYFVN